MFPRPQNSTNTMRSAFRNQIVLRPCNVSRFYASKPMVCTALSCRSSCSIQLFASPVRPHYHWLVCGEASHRNTRKVSTDPRGTCGVKLDPHHVSDRYPSPLKPVPARSSRMVIPSALLSGNSTATDKDLEVLRPLAEKIPRRRSRLVRLRELRADYDWIGAEGPRSRGRSNGN